MRPSAFGPPELNNAKAMLSVRQNHDPNERPITIALRLSSLNSINRRDFLKQLRQALRVINRIPKTRGLISPGKSRYLLLQSRLLNRLDEIHWRLRRRFPPAHPFHAVNHALITERIRH